MRKQERLAKEKRIADLKEKLQALRPGGHGTGQDGTGQDGKGRDGTGRDRT